MQGLHPESLTADLIAIHTAGCAEAALAAGIEAPVPTCPDWTVGELVTHLFEVQHFWCHIIGKRPEGPESYDRPGQPADPVGALRETNRELVELLGAAAPDDVAWSWSSNHTVGFTIRRQTHEALVHHADACAAASIAMPSVEPLVAADGVDEVVDVMLTGLPEWATFLPSAQFVRLETTDTQDRWTMSLGEVSGTSSESGVTYNGLPAADRVADEIAPDLTIVGESLPLLLWMWGRAPLERLTVTGEAEIAAVLRDTITSATQ